MTASNLKYNRVEGCGSSNIDVDLSSEVAAHWTKARSGPTTGVGNRVLSKWTYDGLQTWVTSLFGVRRLVQYAGSAGLALNHGNSWFGASGRGNSG